MPPGLTSPAHLAVIFVVALIALGPERLPGAARQAARTLGELRTWSTSLEREVREAIAVSETESPSAQRDQAPQPAGGEAPSGHPVQTLPEARPARVHDEIDNKPRRGAPEQGQRSR